MPDLVGSTELVYEETGDGGQPTGRRASFAGVEFVPLTYFDLLKVKLHQQVTIRLRWKTARVTESSIPEIVVGEDASGHATLESPFSARTIGLVKGGWIPAGLGVEQNMLVLPDSCTVSEIKGRFRAGARANDEDQDFLDLFAFRSVRINPLLYALEGSLRRNPDPEHVALRVRESIEAIRSALPLAEVIPSGGEATDAIVAMIKSNAEILSLEQRYLMRLAPLIAAPVSASNKASLWEEALSVADDLGVAKHSLVVMAVLSSISAVNGNSPAKRMLKPVRTYSAEMAYNALADLRSLKVLINLFAAFPDQKSMLCTGDKNLALFWAGLRSSGFAMVGNDARCSFAPVKELLDPPTAAHLEAYCGTAAVLPHDSR